MERIIRYVAVLALLALFAPRGAEALPAVFDFEDPATPAERDIVAESHLYCLALAVYFEGGSTDETIEGQQYIAWVVTERARERRRKWGGGDICEVVFYKRAGVCQFTFACLPQARRTPHGGQRWRQAIAIARETLSGSERPADEVRYYMNPALTSDRNACRFRKELVPVAKAGRHEFFREPTEAERAAIAVAQHAECVRYQAALEAQRRKAKAAAERKRLAAIKKKKAKRSRVAKR